MEKCFKKTERAVVTRPHPRSPTLTGANSKRRWADFHDEGKWLVSRSRQLKRQRRGVQEAGFLPIAGGCSSVVKSIVITYSSWPLSPRLFFTMSFFVFSSHSFVVCLFGTAYQLSFYAVLSPFPFPQVIVMSVTIVRLHRTSQYGLISIYEVSCATRK